MSLVSSYNFESAIFLYEEIEYEENDPRYAGFEDSYTYGHLDDEPVPYESAWECYGGLTPDEEWSELYAAK